MSKINRELVNAAYDKAYALIHNDNMHERFDSLRKHIRNEETLNEDEKAEAIKRFDGDYDYFKVVWNYGNRRTCEFCNEKCLATSYCEFCIRKYLKKNSSNWTSENDDIDKILKDCQEQSITPRMIVEWIPYDSLKDIKHLTKGGCADIFSAIWVDGCYKEWDLEEQKLKRGGECKAVLKRLQNVEDANRTWFEEAKEHLRISNKWGNIVQCYGLTKHPSNGQFILVMKHMDIDLRKYILKNRDQLTWKTKVQIIFEIAKAVRSIHDEGSVHRDLHSGNILYIQEQNDWYISDLGFCGPTNKPLKSVYGNLPYIAPEVLSKNSYGLESDIYSIGMLMWEISAERPPFVRNVHNYDLVLNIINGLRPQVVPGTPTEYKDLMKKCWNATPKERPNIYEVMNRLDEINQSLHENEEYWNSKNSPLNQHFDISSNVTSTLIENPHSKVFSYSGLPEPKNATTEEQLAYFTKQLELNIPDDV